jgi:hypothetical protein
MVRSCDADSASSGKSIGAAGGGTAAASAGSASADAAGAGAVLGAARRDDVRVGRFAVALFAVDGFAVDLLGAACFAVVGRFAATFFAVDFLTVAFLAVTFLAVTFFAVAALAATVRLRGVVVRFFAAPTAPLPRAASTTRRTSRSRRDTALSTDPSRCASRPSGSALTKPSIASRTLRDASLDDERPRPVREREDAVALLRAAMCDEPHANEAGETTPR